MQSPPTPASDTRERIRDVAEELFADRGFNGASMRDIAGRCGLGQASLYNHFEGKQGLYEAVLDRGVTPLLELMQSLPNRDQPGQVDAMIASIMNHLASRPRLPRLIQHEAMTGGDYLIRIARSWIHPLVEGGVIDLKRDVGRPWQEDELPLVMLAWLYMMFGHFTMAPLMREVLDHDPLSPEGLARQTRFFQKLARLITAGGDGTPASTGDPHEDQ